MYLACRYTYFDNDYFSSKIQSIAHLIWLSCRRYWLLDTWLYLYQGTINTIWFDTGLSKVLSSICLLHANCFSCSFDICTYEYSIVVTLGFRID